MLEATIRRAAKPFKENEINGTVKAYLINYNFPTHAKQWLIRQGLKTKLDCVQNKSSQFYSQWLFVNTENGESYNFTTDDRTNQTTD